MMTAPEINPKGAKKLPPFRIVVHDSGGYDIYWPDPQQPHHADIAFFRRS